MKKFFLALFVFVASGAYIAYQHVGASVATPISVPANGSGEVAVTPSVDASKGSGSSAPPPTSTLTPKPTPTPTPTPTLSPAPTPTPTPPAPTPTPKGLYVDGTYTGSQADAYYGIVQVRAVVSGGKLTDVQFLQYPNDRRTSQYINQQAMPLLKDEAIQAQSANVNGVSGASDTSAAFVESLGSALAQAKS